MGKKGKKSRKKVLKAVVPFTKDQRTKKVTNIMFQLASHNMTHVITDQVRIDITKYINDGTEVEKDISLPLYSRVLEVRLYNDRNKECNFNLKHRVVAFDDVEDHKLEGMNDIEAVLKKEEEEDDTKDD